MKNAPLSFLAAATVATLMAGCATAPLEVNDSQLNWLNITYQPAKPGAKPCRINLIGVGSIEFMEGLSPRVGNSFSQETDHAHWQDVFQEKLGVPPDVVRGWMQIFVDAGIMQKSKNKIHGKDARRDMAVLNANINREKIICVTDDDEILGKVKQLVSILKSEKSDSEEARKGKGREK